jgi:hypothetical protein
MRGSVYTIILIQKAQYQIIVTECSQKTAEDILIIE